MRPGSLSPPYFEFRPACSPERAVFPFHKQQQSNALLGLDRYLGANPFLFLIRGLNEESDVNGIGDAVGIAGGFPCSCQLRQRLETARPFSVVLIESFESLTI